MGFPSFRFGSLFVPFSLVPFLVLFWLPFGAPLVPFWLPSGSLFGSLLAPFWLKDKIYLFILLLSLLARILRRTQVRALCSGP